MAKEITQADIIVDLLKQHQPCTLMSLKKHDPHLTKRGLYSSASELFKAGIIENFAYENGSRVVRLTGKKHILPCDKCGNPTRVWLLVDNSCKYCNSKITVNKHPFNGEVDTEFKACFAICRLMHLPFGLPTQTYVDYLQLRGAAL